MVARYESRTEPRPDPGWPRPSGTPVHPPMSVSMTAHDVLRVLDVLHLSGVSALLTGGWGVDALIGRQSRTHRDLDLLIDHSERATAFETLIGLGYSTVEVDGDDRATVRQRDGRAIDVEFIDRDDSRNLPAASLDGRGFIVGRPVRCVTAGGQVMLHADGNLPDELRRDLWLLADRCGVTLTKSLARSHHVSYRRAESGDIGAMAVLQHASLRAAFGSGSHTTGRRLGNSVLGDCFRYWHSRLSRQSVWSGVMVVGGAIGATAAVAAPDAPGGIANLFGFHLDPSITDRHLLDPLLQRTLHTAHEFGTDDVRIWLAKSHPTDVRFFERRGWRPDGATFDLNDGLPMIRYARR
jgi:lincosamide nucleotidyltransferase A/C/D/E